jgi:alpha-1,6-mannosyltransferase
MRQRYEQIAKQGRGVHLAGFVSDRSWVAACLASADAFVHASAAETFGFVVAEALCSGTPVVVPARGGAFEMSDPSFAETYTPGDVTGCADAIVRLLARERDGLRAAALRYAANTVITQGEHFARLFATYRALL